MTARLHVKIEDHIATVRLDRPDKNNAIDFAMFDAFIETGRLLSTDSSVRAVVLHGAGNHFCAGIDLSAFQGEGIGAAGSGRMDAREDSDANFFQSAARVWQEIPVPVIAAIHGAAFGGGLQIALGADIRYATADAQLSVMEIKWGIIPDMAISISGHHTVAIDRLKELAFTGRVISGVEALASGLITDLKDDPYPAAVDLARDICNRSPDAIRAIKKLFDDSWRSAPREFLRREAELQMGVMGGRNQMEAVMANMEKRAPDFRDPEP